MPEQVVFHKAERSSIVLVGAYQRHYERPPTVSGRGRCYYLWTHLFATCVTTLRPTSCDRRGARPFGLPT